MMTDVCKAVGREAPRQLSPQPSGALSLPRGPSASLRCAYAGRMEKQLLLQVHLSFTSFQKAILSPSGMVHWKLTQFGQRTFTSSCQKIGAVHRSC